MKYLKILTLSILTVIVMLLSPSLLSAQERSIDWQRWDSEIWINEDGSFTVKETFDINFRGGPFTFGFRNIYRDQLEQIVDFSMSEGSQLYGEDFSESPNTFYITSSSDEYVINWFFPSTTDQTRTFILEYRVIGGLLIDGAGDLMIWSVIGAEHDWDIASSSIVIHMPEGAVVDQSDGPAVRGTAAEIAVSENGTLIGITAQNIKANTPLEIYARFTHGVIPDILPAWQEAYVWRETTGKTIDIGLVLGSLLILVLGSGASYLLWLFKGKDPRGAAVPEYLADPPTPLPPGIVGTLLDEKSDLQDVIATVVDLSKRGFIEIIEKGNSLFGLKSTEFTYRYHAEAGMPERDFEKKLVNGIFGASDFSDLLSGNSDESSLKLEVDLDELQDKFYTTLPGIQKAMYEFAVAEGLFAENPKKVRGKYIAISIAGIMLSAGIMFCLLPMIDLPVNTLACPFISLVLVSVIFAVFGNFMPKKTANGAEEAAKWISFKTYMKDIEKFTDLDSATEKFDAYLPYAIAFGIERDWINTFSRVPATPRPRWYVPYGYYPSTMTGNGYDSAGRKTKDVGESLGRDLRGDRVLPGSSLDRMSNDTFQGLSGMSTGLFSALNTTSQVFRSTPSSSGSSGGGGGFSSGGFSGGGFSSGGGGGAGFG